MINKSNSISYKIVRSTGRRKTLSVCVRQDGSIEVRCGKNVSLSTIKDFVNEKQKWILKKQAEMLKRAEEKAAFRYKEGTMIPFLGKLYPLTFSGNDSRAALTVCFDKEKKCFVMPSNLLEDETDNSLISRLLAEFYKNAARQYLPPLVEEQALIMGVTPSAIKINSARTRWGSCSGKNSLNFSYMLMKTSPACIRYVVIHELAHIKHHDHSAAFWNTVEKYCPDFRQCKHELKSFS